MEPCNVVLVLRSGGDFTFRDVELLSYHLKKEWRGEGELKVYCLYDKVNEVYTLKDVTLLPMGSAWSGWWAKMNLFSPELDIYRPFLYVDLDTAVVGDISSLWELVGEKFVTLEDFYKRGKLASGVMWFPVDTKETREVWGVWGESPKKFMKQYRGDQDFISNFIKLNTFWQTMTNMICSFKVRGSDRSWLQEIPSHISIVCFHGNPRIPKATQRVFWVKQYVDDTG